MNPTGVPVQSGNMPPAAAPTDEDKNMAMISHFGNIFTWGLAGLIIYFVKKDSSKYAAFHGLQAALAGLILGIVGSVVCVGPLVLIILSIMAGLKVMNGEYYEYPLIGKFARETVYGKG